MSKPVKSFLLRLILLAILAGAMVLLVQLDASCLVRKYLGIICPACGMSRAWLAVLRLEFASAFSYHPMFWSIPVLAFVYLFDGRPFGSEKLGRWTCILILAGLAVCYAVRLVAYLSGNLYV